MLLAQESRSWASPAGFWGRCPGAGREAAPRFRVRSVRRAGGTRPRGSRWARTMAAGLVEWGGLLAPGTRGKTREGRETGLWPAVPGGKGRLGAAPGALHVPGVSAGRPSRGPELRPQPRGWGEPALSVGHLVGPPGGGPVLTACAPHPPPPISTGLATPEGPAASGSRPEAGGPAQLLWEGEGKALQCCACKGTK